MSPPRRPMPPSTAVPGVGPLAASSSGAVPTRRCSPRQARSHLCPLRCRPRPCFRRRRRDRNPPTATNASLRRGYRCCRDRPTRRPSPPPRPVSLTVGRRGGHDPGGGGRRRGDCTRTSRLTLRTMTRQRVTNDPRPLQRNATMPVIPPVRRQRLPPTGCNDGNGSGNARKYGDGDDVVVIGALSLANADECDDRNVRNRRVGTSLLNRHCRWKMRGMDRRLCPCHPCVGRDEIGGMRRRWHDIVWYHR
jgi:hypothetical protein